jgi:hypothetical protein
MREMRRGGRCQRPPFDRQQWRMSGTDAGSIGHAAGNCHSR